MGVIANAFKNFGLSEDAPEWFMTWLGSRPSKTGINVNEKTAMKFSAVFACIRILSETLASTPIILYQDRKVGDKTSGKNRIVDHPLYDILKVAPNDKMPSMVFKETMMSHIVSSGNGYAQIRKNRKGEIYDLNILPWTQTEVREDLITGEIEYWTNDRGKFIKLSPGEVFHIPGLGFKGIKGYSPIRMAMEAVGLGLAAETFAASFYANGANVSGIAEYPGKLKDESYKRFKQDFSEAYSGLGKAKKVMFLEEGLKFHQITIPQNEAQFIETRKFQIEEIARIYRIPLHLLQNLDRATNNNIEHQSLEFVMYTMLPWFRRWEEYISFKLLTKEERRKGIFAEFLVTALLRGDVKSRAMFYQFMRQNGIMNADEIRELENMNPQEGDCGRTYFINSAMVPVEKAAQSDDGTTAPNPRQPRPSRNGGEGNG